MTSAGQYKARPLNTITRASNHGHLAIPPMIRYHFMDAGLSEGVA